MNHKNPKCECNVQLSMLETMINALVEDGLKPRLILTALHNACVHGERLEAAGWTVTEDNLVALFNGFDISMKAFEDME